MPTIAPPLRLEPAYDDRAAVLEQVRRRGPYPLLAVGGSYAGAEDEHGLLPWFRSYWALDGSVVDDEAAAVLHEERFVQAARDLFGGGTVEPVTLIINLMGPMGVGQQHVDTPTFRGVTRSEVPPWLLNVMGQSALFEHWRVQVASALTWFYECTDGEYRYWPDGVDAPPIVERAPFGNVAVVSDSDLTYHQVGAIGDRATGCRIEPGSELRFDDGWQVITDGRVTGEIPQLRVSLLWRALVLPDGGPTDDVDLDIVRSILGDDLRRRGIDVPASDDVLQWADTLTPVYYPALRQAHGTPDRLAGR